MVSKMYKLLFLQYFILVTVFICIMVCEKCVYNDFLRIFSVCSNDWWRSWKQGRREVQSQTRSDLWVKPCRWRRLQPSRQSDSPRRGPPSRLTTTWELVWYVQPGRVSVSNLNSDILKYDIVGVHLRDDKAVCIPLVCCMLSESNLDWPFPSSGPYVRWWCY